MVSLRHYLKQIVPNRFILKYRSLRYPEIYGPGGSKMKPQKSSSSKEVKKPKKLPIECHTERHLDWENRWHDKKMKKVLMFSPKDFSGSFFKWTQAINNYSENTAARMVTLYTHKYGYNYDFVYNAYNEFGLKEHTIKNLVDTSDVLHIKDEFYIFNTEKSPAVSKFTIDLIEAFKKQNKPVVATHYGGYARKFENDKKYINLMSSFEARIAMTPDLNFSWFNGYFIPHSVETKNTPFSWQESKIFAHSPSSAFRKGTDIMWDVAENLEMFKVRNWKLDMISGVTHSECLDRKKHAELFFDQAGRESQEKLGISNVIGWYGNSALEAMVHGIPTIAHLSDLSFDGARRAGKNIKEKCPILNTGINSVSMQKTLEQYLDLSSPKKMELAKATREWIDEFHSNQVIGKELSTVYNTVLSPNYSLSKNIGESREFI